MITNNSKTLIVGGPKTRGVDKITVETGERFVHFTDPDIPHGLIIPLDGKMFEYAIYKVPFEGDVEVAKKILEGTGSLPYESIVDNNLKIVMYYSHKLDENPAVQQRMKLIAQHAIDKFEIACLEYNSEAEIYNKIIRSML